MALQINYQCELLSAIAQAYNERDLNLLDECRRISRDWLQSSRDANAQQELIDAMYDAICQLAEPCDDEDC